MKQLSAYFGTYKRYVLLPVESKEAKSNVVGDSRSRIDVNVTKRVEACNLASSKSKADDQKDGNVNTASSRRPYQLKGRDATLSCTAVRADGSMNSHCSSLSTSPSTGVATKPLPTVATRSLAKTNGCESNHPFSDAPADNTMCDESNAKSAQERKEENPSNEVTMVAFSASSRSTSAENFDIPAAVGPAEEVKKRHAEKTTRPTTKKHENAPSNREKDGLNINIYRIDVGTRVYAKWHGNEKWYWGKCTHVKYKRQKPYFDVKFDDGDVRSSIPAIEVISERAYNSDQHHTKARAQTVTRVLCDCPMCSRPPCMRCHMCCTNDVSGCFQKVSLEQE